MNMKIEELPDGIYRITYPPQKPNRAQLEAHLKSRGHDAALAAEELPYLTRKELNRAGLKAYLETFVPLLHDRDAALAELDKNGKVELILDYP